MVGRMLDRKLLRDLWHLRGQMAAIGVVVACGVATVVTTRTSYTSLLESRAAYYAQYRFADVFAHLKRAPAGIARRLAALPGVAAVEPRVVAEVTLDVPGLAEPATGRLVSVPVPRRPILDDVHLRRGRWPEPGRGDEVIASEAFAAANALAPGDSLGAVINGRWRRLRIVGIGISPEYVYEIGEGQLFPDSRRFGVLWLPEDALAAAFDMTGAFNDVAIRLGAGASEADVVARTDAVLARYGGLGAYGRSEQVSARFINDEIAQNRVSGTIIPAIFLGIAAFLLNVVLARLVATQREQIAVLKAFGYTNAAVGRHYLKLSLVAVFAGAALGAGLGAWLASLVNASYARFYRFPEFLYRVDLAAIGLAVLVAALAAVAGAAGAVRRVVALPPAAALQAEAPPRFRPGPLERLGLHRWLSPAGRIVARDLERRPFKALLSLFGIGLATATLIVGRFFIDAMARMADVQFRYAERENLTVTFRGPVGARVGTELARLPGVTAAEPFRATAVRIRAGHRSRRTALVGLDPAGELRALVGPDLHPASIPPDGVVLTSKLGAVLGVGVGDTVTLEVLEGARPVRRTAVAGLVDEMFGLTVYMDRAAANRLLREGPAVSGAYLRVDPLAAPALYARLKALPGVASVSSRDAALASFEETLAESIGIVTTVLVVFAGAIASAIVYNSARVALSERGRELASLRVLGFSRGEVSRMLLGEQAVLTTLGAAAGLGLGYGIAVALSGLYQWELFRVPVVITGRTYAFAILVVTAAFAASGLLVARRIARLELVAVLKTRE